MSEPFVTPVVCRFRQLINRALGDDAFAQELLDPETRAMALEKFGLDKDEVDRALHALEKVDLKAIDEFRSAMQPEVAIPI